MAETIVPVAALIVLRLLPGGKGGFRERFAHPTYTGDNA
jgi:hypothetical protein